MDTPSSSTSTSPPDEEDDKQIMLRQVLCTEPMYLPKVDYVKTVQKGKFRETYREMLVTWLEELERFFLLHAETTATALNYFDRFLSRKIVKTQYLELAMLACVLVAAKMREMRTPSMVDLLFFADNRFRVKELKSMELLVLKSLNWEMNAVTPHEFVGHYFNMVHGESCQRKEAEFMATALLRVYKFLRYPASVLGAACVVNAIQDTGDIRRSVISQLAEATGIDRDFIAECHTETLEYLCQAYTWVKEREEHMGTLRRTHTTPESHVHHSDLWSSSAHGRNEAHV